MPGDGPADAGRGTARLFSAVPSLRSARRMLLAVYPTCAPSHDTGTTLASLRHEGDFCDPRARVRIVVISPDLAASA